MKRLKSLDVDEVSLVDIGANKKKFLVFKSKVGVNTMNFKKIAKALRIKKDAEGEEKKEAMKKAEKEPEVKKAEGEKVLSEGAQAALKAIGRILTPFKEEITDSDVDAILEELGIEFPHSEETEKSEKEEEELEPAVKAKEEEGDSDIKKLFAIPEEVKEEHAIEALNKAKEAMCDHLEKMGYAKYEEKQPAMKAKEEGEDEIEKSKYAHIFKAHKELVQKNADLEKTVNEMRKKDIEKELVQKSASFTHLGLKSEDVIEVLKVAKEVGEKHYEKVCKQYEALNEQAKKGGIFKEYGSSMTSGGASDATARLDAAVKSVVQKSDTKITFEQAYDKFLGTEEGKRLYAEAQSARPFGI
jgi:hypothetical protein